MKPIALIAVLVMTFLTGPVRAAEVKLTQESNSVKVEVDGKPFTVYHFAPAGGDAHFHRPFAYPVVMGDGQAVTSDQVVTNAKEHPHHRSVWVAHGDVNGVDHWSHNAPKAGVQRHVKFDKVEGDTIVQQLVWGGPKGGGDAVSLLNETRTLRFFALDDGSRGIDLTVALTPAGKEAVTMGDTKESGLAAVRVHPEIGTGEKGKPQKATLTNSAGATGEKAIWGKPAAWCDASGTINGKPYGVAIFDHPSNPRHPTTWHTRGYGLHAANIFGQHDFDPKNKPKGAGDMKIEPGRTVTFKYRILFHAGDAKAAKVDERYKEWAK